MHVNDNSLDREATDQPPRTGSCLSACLSNFLFILLFTVTGLAIGAATMNGEIPFDCFMNTAIPIEVRRYCVSISRHARANELDPDLVATLIWFESGGDPDAYSHSGAVGLMQVMPRDGLAADYLCADQPCFDDRPTIQELQEPDYNIETGTRLLAVLIQARGDLREALKAYGPMDADYRYADAILALYQRLKR